MNKSFFTRIILPFLSILSCVGFANAGLVKITNENIDISDKDAKKVVTFIQTKPQTPAKRDLPFPAAQKSSTVPLVNGTYSWIKAYIITKEGIILSHDCYNDKSKPIVVDENTTGDKLAINVRYDEGSKSLKCDITYTNSSVSR